MNGYSPYARKLTDKQLAIELAEVSVDAKYSNPAQDIHWLYRALLEEKKRREPVKRDCSDCLRMEMR